jgi:hypothetical protein
MANKVQCKGKCRRWLELTEENFYRSKTSKTGFKSMCKYCYDKCSKRAEVLKNSCIANGDKTAHIKQIIRPFFDYNVKNGPVIHIPVKNYEKK